MRFKVGQQTIREGKLQFFLPKFGKQFSKFDFEKNHILLSWAAYELRLRSAKSNSPIKFLKRKEMHKDMQFLLQNRIRPKIEPPSIYMNMPTFSVNLFSRRCEKPFHFHHIAFFKVSEFYFCGYKVWKLPMTTEIFENFSKFQKINSNF